MGRLCSRQVSRLGPKVLRRLPTRPNLRRRLSVRATTDNDTGHSPADPRRLAIASTPSRPQHHRSPANQVRHDSLPVGARIADRVTAVFGSWGFILIQSFLIALWLTYNAYAAVHYLHVKQFDPYPFILLNLLFSTQAAYAAPLILLSQNRTAERDRVKAEHDFDVNVLALRTLAELLGDVHDVEAQRDLRARIEELLGADPDRPASRRPDEA